MKSHMVLLSIVVIALTACGANGEIDRLQTVDGSPARSSSVSMPALSGPITAGFRGGPWGAALEPVVRLGEQDYVEEEYFFSGAAEGRDASGAEDGTRADYTSRMLVVRPRDASRFNGTILVE